MKPFSKFVALACAALLSLTMVTAVACTPEQGKPSPDNDPPSIDAEWNETLLYAMTEKGSTSIAPGILALEGAHPLSDYANKAGYYPIDVDAGATITYNLLSDKAAQVGLYAEFSKAPTERNFSDSFKLSVNGTETTVNAAMTKGTRNAPTNTFVLLGFVNLEKDTNTIALEVKEAGEEYNFYGFRFTAESAEVKLNKDVKAPDGTLIDTGYVKYRGEERVEIKGTETKYLVVEETNLEGCQTEWGGNHNATQVPSLYCTKDGSYFTFKFDLSDWDDVSRAGLLINRNTSRKYSKFEYSTDGENWTTVFEYGDGNTKFGDWHVNTGTCTDSWMLNYRGSADDATTDLTDANLYSVFYEIGEWFGTGKVLYLRGSKYHPDPVPADFTANAGENWIGSFSLFKYLEVVGDDEE